MKKQELLVPATSTLLRLVDNMIFPFDLLSSVVDVSSISSDGVLLRIKFTSIAMVFASDVSNCTELRLDTLRTNVSVNDFNMFHK